MPRRQHSYHFLYKTTCTVNGKYYVGMHSTTKLEDGYLGSGKRLGYSLKKHGRENHRREILEFCETRSSLKIREREFVSNEMLNDPLCINLNEGGEGSWYRSNKVWQENPEFHRETTSKGGKQTGERWKETDFQKLHSLRVAEQNKKMHSQGIIKPPNWTGRKHSEETRKKIGEKNSLTQKGENNSQFGKVWIHNLELRICKAVKKEEAENLTDGWKKGRKIFK